MGQMGGAMPNQFATNMMPGGMPPGGMGAPGMGMGMNPM